MNKIYLNIYFKKNNIIVTLVKHILYSNNLYTIKTISSGMCGFKNKQKKTPLACLFIIKKILINEPISIIFNGDSFFKNLIIDLLKLENIKIISIIEKTNVPYNGCKYSNKKIINEYK